MLLNRFRNTVEILYIDAKHSVVATTSEIPYWMFIVIIILGWNEFMAVLRNPIYFILLIISITTVYALYRMNLIQPTLKVIRSILRDIGRQIVDKLTAIENQNVLNERYEMYKKNYTNPHFNDDIYDDKMKRFSDMNIERRQPPHGHGLVQSSSLSHLSEAVHFIDNTEELDKQYEMNVKQNKRNKLLKRHTFQVPVNPRSYDDDDDDDDNSYEMENLKKYEPNGSENRSHLGSKLNISTTADDDDDDDEYY